MDIRGVERRIDRLGASEDELGLANLVRVLRRGGVGGSADEGVWRVLEARLSRLEERYRDTGFLDPPEAICEGALRVLTCENGRDARINLGRGGNGIQHGLVVGKTGWGKTGFLGNVLSEAARRGEKTLFIDSSGSVRTVREVRETHVFVGWEDLHINPYDIFGGIHAGTLDAVMNAELARSYKLQNSEFLLQQVTSDLRSREVSVCLPGIVDYLERQKYRPGTKHYQFRESALFVVKNALIATGELFSCAQGFDVRALCCRNIVIETCGLLTAHEEFLVRVIFGKLHLWSLAKARGVGS